MNISKCAEIEINKIFDWCEENDFDDIDINGQEFILRYSKGIYQINYHGVTQQIWVSSPVSGAHHFQLDGDTWISTRCKTKKLWDIITEELSA
jgi:frataxin-like iron-binding protein CyaY